MPRILANVLGHTRTYTRELCVDDCGRLTRPDRNGTYRCTGCNRTLNTVLTRAVNRAGHLNVQVR